MYRKVMWLAMGMVICFAILMLLANIGSMRSGEPKAKGGKEVEKPKPPPPDPMDITKEDIHRMLRDTGNHIATINEDIEATKDKIALKHREYWNMRLHQSENSEACRAICVAVLMCKERIEKLDAQKEKISRSEGELNEALQKIEISRLSELDAGTISRVKEVMRRSRELIVRSAQPPTPETPTISKVEWKLNMSMDEYMKGGSTGQTPPETPAEQKPVSAQ